MTNTTVLQPKPVATVLQKNPYLPNLTPLRGIAALLTVFFHVNISTSWGFTNAGLTFTNRLYLMVDFFFILSGFIMCHVYGKSFASGVSKAAFKKFTIARFSRVYPLHLAMLLYVIMLFSLTHLAGLPKQIVETENGLYSVFTNLFLLHSMNFHQWFSWDHASWSISTEWWAYMIFPFLVLPFSKLHSAGRVITCFLCFAGYLLITFYIVPIVTVPPSIPFVANDPAKLTIDVSYQYGIIRCLCGFILGMMMYQGYNNNWGRKILGSGVTFLALTAGLFLCAQFDVPDVFTVIFLPLILLSGAYGSKALNRVFSTRPLQRLGDLSFSIYLVHEPIIYTRDAIISYFQKGHAESLAELPPPMSLLSSTFLFIWIAALAIAAASVTFKYVEVPARKRLNALAGK